MAISYVSGSATSYASRTNTTVTAPSGIANDDVLLASVFTLVASGTPPTPTGSGWTAIGSPTTIQGNYPGDDFPSKLTVFIKKAASESGDYTFTHTTASSAAHISVYRGVDTTTAQDATSTANNAGGSVGGTGTTTTYTGLTTVTNGAMIVGFSCDYADSSNNLSPPTGMTERLDTVVLYSCDLIVSSAGATGNKTYTNNNATNASPWFARLVALRPASGSGYTLDAAAGSYAITGTAAGTQRNRLVDAAAGSYAITGTAAGTQYGRQVAALAGSYAVTGSDVTFPKTWILDASAGSYALTGTAAGLQLGRVLDAAAGSYAITGQTAAITIGYQVAAAAGSYAITGADATFPRTYLLDAGAGSYTISGTDAALTIEAFGAYVLDADGGSYLISGTDAALMATHADLIADGGSYLFTGEDAGLVYVIALAAEGGSYEFTGTPATLVYDGFIPPEPEPVEPPRTHGGGGRWGTSGRRIVWPKKKREEWQEYVRDEIRRLYGPPDDLEEAVEAVAPYVPAAVDPRAVQAVLKALVPDVPMAEIKAVVAPLVEPELDLIALDEDFLRFVEARWQNL